MKKQPGERYASVTAFADDIRRHLKDEPVRARADSFGYRTAKFLRRNRIPVALASLAIVATLGGLGGTLMQATWVAEQRDFALRQLSRVEAVNDLNAFLLYDAAPSGKPFTAGELIARAERIVERAAPDSARTDMLVAIGRQYAAMDEDASARRLLGKAFELSRNEADRSTPARAACAWVQVLGHQGDRQTADRVFNGALAALPEKPQYLLHRIECLLAGSGASQQLGDAAAGVARAEAALKLATQLAFPSKVLEQRASEEVAESYRVAGQFQQADTAFRVTYDRLKALGREDTQAAGTLFNNWGIMLEQMDQPRRAEELLRSAIEISKSDGAEKGVSPMLLANFAHTLRDLDRFPEAARYVDRAYSEALRAGDEVVINISLIVRASIYRELGDFTTASRMIAEAEPRFRRMLPPGHLAFASLASERSMLAAAQHDYATAITAANRAVDLARANPASSSMLPVLLVRRARIELEMGRIAESRADAESVLELERASLASGSGSSVFGLARLQLGHIPAAEGNASEARNAYRSAVEPLRATLGSDHPDTRLAERLSAGGTVTSSR